MFTLQNLQLTCPPVGVWLIIINSKGILDGCCEKPRRGKPPLEYVPSLQFHSKKAPENRPQLKIKRIVSQPSIFRGEIAVLVSGSRVFSYVTWESSIARVVFGLPSLKLTAKKRPLKIGFCWKTTITFPFEKP